MMLRPHLRRSGFTLLELSVVLTVIALLAGTGMTVAGNALKAADRISTQEKLNTIKIALDSHAKTYGYLPCPARRDYIPTDTGFGVEGRTTSTDCTTGVGGIVSSAGTGVIYGALPVRSLSLPDSYAGDAWGNKFTYAVTNGNNGSNDTGFNQDPSRWTAGVGQIVINYGPTATSHPVTVNRNTTVTYTNANSSGNANLTFSTSLTAGTLVTLKPTTTGGYSGSYFVKTTGTTSLITSDSALASNVAYNGTDTGGTVNFQDATNGAAAAYAVVSHGPNGMGAYPLSGTTTGVTIGTTCTTGTLDYENCDDTVLGPTNANVGLYEADYNDNTATGTDFYDDYIIWGSNDGFRIAVNDKAYTGVGGATAVCPTGVCEPWCAKCEYNYPGADQTNIPPSTTLDHADTASRVLCKKVITSNASDCKAACFWAGKSVANGYYKCP